MLLTTPLDQSLIKAIADALGDAPMRLCMLETPAGRMWLKRAERLSFRWRLQKGNGRRSFENDRNGLHLLARAGLPVAPILAEGPDYFVTPDLGQTLRAVLVDQGNPGARKAAFRAAGVALAALHTKGYSHGRPALRDLCWDGAAVRFIDMERFSTRRRSEHHIAADMLVFMHSVFAAAATAHAELDTAIQAYCAAGGPLEATIALADRLQWLRPTARWMRQWYPDSRDLNALEPTLAYVTALR